MTKLTKWHVHQWKTQISICPVWLESLLWAQCAAKDPNFLHADSEDSDQIGRMPRLIWVFAEYTCHFAGFVMREFNFFQLSKVFFFTVTCSVSFLQRHLPWEITLGLSFLGRLPNPLLHWLPSSSTDPTLTSDPSSPSPGTRNDDWVILKRSLIHEHTWWYPGEKDI